MSDLLTGFIIGLIASQILREIVLPEMRLILEKWLPHA